MAARTRRAALAFAIAALLVPASAGAQANRTWVASTGSDANPCNRDNPCRTLGGAYAVTASGGEINSLDAADFGPLTIDRPLTLDLSPGPGLIGNSGTGTAIVVAAGPNDDVILRGLGITGSGSACPYGGGTGIDVQSARNVAIENAQIGQQRTAVEVDPTAGAPTVTLDKVAIDGACTGVDIAPAQGASATAMIRKSTIANAGVGVFASGTSHTWVNGVTFTSNTAETQALGGGAVIDRIGYGPVGATGDPGPAGPGGPPGTAGPPAFKLVVSSLRASARRVRYRTTAAAAVTLKVLRHGSVVATVRGSARAGRNSLPVRGLRAGSYRLRLTAIGRDGQKVVRSASLRVR